MTTINTINNSTLKIIFIGDSGTGKSTLVHTKTHNYFVRNIETTSGSEYTAIYNDVQTNNGTNHITMQLWDTAGQERFRSLVPMYTRDADGVALIFDISDKKTFDSIKTYWINTFEKDENNNYSTRNGNRNNIYLLLVGTKNDLRRNVSNNEILCFCEEYGLEYVETSSKNMYNILKLFDQLLIKTYEKKSHNLVKEKELDILTYPKNKYCCT